VVGFLAILMVFGDGGVRNRVSWRHSVSGFGFGLAVGVRHSVFLETPGVPVSCGVGVRNRVSWRHSVSGFVAGVVVGV
jgi:hypothetical protein